MDRLQADIDKRVTEKVMGDYYQRMARLIDTSEMGEKSTRFKLDDPEYLKPNLPKRESQHLRSQVELFGDRLETIRAAVLKSKQGYESCQVKLQAVEDQIQTFITAQKFRDDVQKIEARQQQFIESKLRQFAIKLTQQETKLD